MNRKNKIILAGVFDIIVYVVLNSYFMLSIFTYILFCITFFSMITKGQTLGQFSFGLKLISLNDKNITYLQIFTRHNFVFISLLLYLSKFMGLISFINEKGQLPQDYLCNTLVVEKNYVNTEFTTKKISKVAILSSLLISLYIVFIEIQNF